MYRGEKSLGIWVDGHDVLLIPHTPNSSPHPTNPTGGGVGREGGVLEEYRVHMHTYTHVGTRITVVENRKSSDSISDSTVLGNFTGKLNAKPACS